MHLVCCCSLPVWRSFLKKGTPVTYFCPALDPPLGGSGRKNNNTCKGPWVFHPYQVSSKIHQAVLEKLKMWKFTDRRTTTDGRTDDGRCAGGNHWHCMVTIQRVQSLPRVTIQHGIMTRVNNWRWSPLSCRRVQNLPGPQVDLPTRQRRVRLAFGLRLVPC